MNRKGLLCMYTKERLNFIQFIYVLMGFLVFNVLFYFYSISIGFFTSICWSSFPKMSSIHPCTYHTYSYTFNIATGLCFMISTHFENGPKWNTVAHCSTILTNFIAGTDGPDEYCLQVYQHIASADTH